MKAQCLKREAECICGRVKNHKDKWHKCECGGSWAFDGKIFELGKMPTHMGLKPRFRIKDINQ